MLPRIAIPLLKCLLLGLLLAQGARAEQSVEFGDYTIHYIAVNSTFLEPEIARQYGITRSERQAFLNISVLRRLPEGGTQAVNAEINGQVGNLLGQSTTLNFRLVEEGSAIYYIAPFEFSNAERLRFQLLIQPEGQGPSHPLTWETQLYAF